MTTILIIEDEIKTARELKRSVEAISGGLAVLDILPSVRSGIRWLRHNPAPDLILSDIQLADGLSFEIFSEVQVDSMVIFCTAYDEYAINAFRTNSVDYLLKPIDIEKLRQAIDKFHRMRQLFATQPGANTERGVDRMLEQWSGSHKKTLLVYFQDKIIPVKTDDIAYLQYEFGNVTLYAFDRRKFAMNQSLDDFEAQLPPSDFFRVNRQFIVHRNAVESLSGYFSRRLLLKLRLPVNVQLIVSKTKSPHFLKWIETI